MEAGILLHSFFDFDIEEGNRLRFFAWIHIKDDEIRVFQNLMQTPDGAAFSLVGIVIPHGA